MEKSNVSTNMAVDTIACTTEDLYQDISNVIATDGAHKQCVRSLGRGVVGNDTNQETTLQMESEEMLRVISVAANEDADNCERTGNEDTPMCTVGSDCITKNEAGAQFLYDINWKPDKVQPGLNGGKNCLAFKSGDTWVPYPPLKLATWRYITTTIIFDRLTRLNDGVALRRLIKCTHVLWEALTEKGGLRLNDFFYDREDCSQQWVVSDSTRVGDGVCNDNDARRDVRWGWVPSSIPCEYGEIRMIVRDLIGNCWSTVYINGEFSSRFFEYEMAESFDAATGELLIPMQNPVFSLIVEGKVFSGEDNICLRHVRGREVTYDGRVVVEKSAVVSGTVCSDGSRRTGQGTKRKATTKRDNGGTTTVAGRGGRGKGRGGGAAMVGGRGRGRGRGQGGAAMDGETGGKNDGRKGPPRRNRRPEEAAVAEMRRLQRSTELCIPYRPFVRLVREVVQKEDVATQPMRFGMLAIQALLEAVETYLVHLMESTNEVAIHSKRVTILTKDMRLVDGLQKPLVDWMCNDHDIDMSKRDGGGSYDTSAFKKFVRSQARESQMLKTGGGDELKPNAAEILALSRMNEVPQRDPIDYHELATMVVDGVKYVLLDQIVDFMKSGGEDKNLIHEALHEVTEEAITAAEVVDVECVKDRTLDLVSRTPVSRWNIFEAVKELTAASTDVDRRRKRKCRWQMLVAEHDTARTHTTDTTVQDTDGTVSLADVRTVLKNPAANSATVHGGFREWTLPPRHPSRDFNEGLEQASQ
ncbi:hypothetical protein CBR_g3789 [Chara braunii]|uniref:Core Histone H2A/H2B/H3 domain-containing protein n=1 Tax=Chara braunii TaxID=69332 RepID=A0A388KGC3_CHABU|nr:hypothetical protein CBR_g3789 [Chara braunii]|eukprot:GBG69091.1 hypothetical protein CBR_g3789 [Chara braunii]